ncbi:hypothetical protein QBC44DRAFT_109828 [Cladorrhinum sp. PSN332]|nr:hypothetical protein QBC44DRAFT_109828 [Cladorrhinum sp. PSN332]
MGNNGDNGRRSVQIQSNAANEQMAHGQGKASKVQAVPRLDCTHLAPAHLTRAFCNGQGGAIKETCPPRRPSQAPENQDFPSTFESRKKGQKSNAATQWEVMRGTEPQMAQNRTASGRPHAHTRLRMEWVHLWRTVEPRGRYRVLQGFAFPHRPDFNVGKTTLAATTRYLRDTCLLLHGLLSTSLPTSNSHGSENPPYLPVVATVPTLTLGQRF